jgi:hypothetical protein
VGGRRNREAVPCESACYVRPRVRHGPHFGVPFLNIDSECRLNCHMAHRGYAINSPCRANSRPWLLVGHMSDSVVVALLLTKVARGASSALQRPVTAADVTAACELAVAVLAEPPADPYDVLLTPWHPYLAGKGVPELAQVVALWDYLLVDKAAVAAMYAHVAQRYVKVKKATNWEGEVANEAMRGAVAGWWAATYGAGSQLAHNVLSALQYCESWARTHRVKVPALSRELQGVQQAFAALARFPCPVMPKPMCHVLRTALGLEDPPNVDYAAPLGQVRRLEAAVAAGQRMSADTAETGTGSLACLTWLQEHGCPWTEGTCRAAARNGHLECLRYAHEHGCPWNDSTSMAAAEGGHLACMQYAHEQGCAWSRWSTLFAAQKGHLACLSYAWDHGAPRTPDVCRAAEPDGPTAACFAFIHERGCPRPDCPHRAAQEQPPSVAGRKRAHGAVDGE